MSAVDIIASVIAEGEAAQREMLATLENACAVIRNSLGIKNDDARDAARYRWGVEHARWLRHEHEAYVAIPVALDANLSCAAMMSHAIDKAMAEGKS